MVTELIMPELELEEGDIKLSLRNFSRHRRYMRPALLDATRLLEDGQSPCYVVDWQELSAYMYERSTRSQDAIATAAMVSHLFANSEITFVLGPGTLLEIERELTIVSGTKLLDRYETAIRDGKVPSVEEVESGIYESEKRFSSFVSREQNRAVVYGEPVHALLELVQRENFLTWSELRRQLNTIVVDRSAWEHTIREMVMRRPSPDAIESNVADALNIATVVGVRRGMAISTTAGAFGHLYPYLLTHTNVLTAEDRFAEDQLAEEWGYDIRVTRTPLEAVYSSIASGLFRDPAQLVDHLSDLDARIGGAERRLRKQQAGRIRSSQTAPNQDAKFTTRAAAGRPLSKPLVDQVGRLADIFEDDIFASTQVVMQKFERLAPKSSIGYDVDGDDDRGQYGKFMDAISTVRRVLRTKGNLGTVLQFAWDTMISVEIDEGEDVTIYEYVNRNPTTVASIASGNVDGVDDIRDVVLRVERYAEGYWAVSWPTLTGPSMAEKVVRYASSAYTRHGIDEVRLRVGTTTGVDFFVAELPIDFSMILSESPGHPKWLRFDSEAFDLYFDLAYQPRAVSGTIVRHPNRAHLIDLYRETASRFMYDWWLDTAFREAGMS